MSISAAHYSILKGLDLDSLTTFANAACDELRLRQATQARAMLRIFNYGDIAEFRDRYGQRRRMKIERINEKTASGQEVDANTNAALSNATRWRVHPKFLTKVVPLRKTT